MWLKKAEDSELKSIKDEAKDLKDGAKELSKVVSDHLEKQELKEEVAKEVADKMDKAAKVPKKWEKTVRHLKKEKKIDNPFALVNWMENEGYKSGGK